MLYTDFYRYFIAGSKAISGGRYLEIGSGGGFLKDVFPEVITSDIQNVSTVDMVFSAEKLPFDDECLACIMMLNVFHHIPRPSLFLKEAQRVLIPGGKVIMIEPANSFFSRFIYSFHHEDFDPLGSAELEAGKPLSRANMALPYIYFERDRLQFEAAYKQLAIKKIRYHTPFLYILSGGLSKPALFPGFLYRPAKLFERLFSPLFRYLGLFCTIELEKSAELEAGNL
jgi:SAM-dependent methyltransferase